MSGKKALSSAGEGASTSASTSKRRRKRNESDPVDALHDVKSKKDQKMEKKPVLPDDCWAKILESVDDFSVISFASVCKGLRRVQKRSGRRLETKLKDYERRHVTDKLDYKDFDTLSEGWCLWAMSLSTEEEEKRMRRITNAEALHGYLNLLKHSKDSELIGQKIIFDEYTCAFATAGGYLEVLMWLRDNNCPWDEFTCFKAAQGGHLEVLKYAHKNQCPLVLDEVFEDICSASALGGNVEVLKYLRKNGFEPDNDYTSNLFCAACKRGHLELLRYIYENEKPFLDHFDDVYDFWMGTNLESVVEGGHVEILKYFRGKKEKAFEYTSEIIGTYAVHGGHFAMVKYLHEDGCTLGEKTLKQAVGGGYFEIKEGDFEVLKYLHENGCPWGEWTCDALVEKYRKMKRSRYYSAGQSLAAKGSDYAVAKYLTDKRCPGYENLKSMFTERDKKRQRAILQQQAKCSSSS